MENDTVEIEISSSLQDYLETIIELGKHGVRLTDIADHLSVSKASVNRAIARLKLLGLVDQEPYGLLSLTEEGRVQADEVLRRHQLLRGFLVEVLGVDEDVAENDACKIEHHVSEQTLMCIKAYMEKK